MMDENNVKQICREMMNDSVVYRDNCIERHKGVDKMEKRVDWMYRFIVGVLLLGIINVMVTLMK